MRIAIVNDMRMAVEALQRIVGSVPEHQIAWVALDGAEAVRKCAASPPDLVLMDLIMPVMDGVQATREIMAKTPCAILVVTANVTVNSHKVYEAMGFGALDAVDTPVLKDGLKSRGAQTLLNKISMIGRLVRKPFPPENPPAKPSAAGNRTEYPPLIAIGASTGGPKAIATILADLPADLPASVVVVQHIDHVFAEGLAEWLNQQTKLRVRTARAGERPTIGVVDIAATNDHLIMLDDATFAYTRHPLDLPYRPSVDVFFESLASWPTGLVTGVLLTGIGLDGGRGMLKLTQHRQHTIAQDEASCVVFGMPKAAILLNAASEVLPPPQIAQAILRRLQQRLKPLERTPS